VTRVTGLRIVPTVPHPTKTRYEERTKRLRTDANNQNGDGRNEGQGFLAQYPDGAVKFYQMLANWRDEGDFKGLVLQ
jgi:hypothetical protein